MILYMEILLFWGIPYSIYLRGRNPEDSAVVLSTSTLGFWSLVWHDALEDQALALHSAPCRVSLEDIKNSRFGVNGLGVG